MYTLNRVPARYVSSSQGSVLTEVSLEKDQNRAAIDVAMMEALRQDLARAALRPPSGAAADLSRGPRR